MTCEVWGVSGLETQSSHCCDPLCRSRQGLPTAGRVLAVGAWGYLALPPRGMEGEPPQMSRGHQTLQTSVLCPRRKHHTASCGQVIVPVVGFSKP